MPGGQRAAFYHAAEGRVKEMTNGEMTNDE
jgi:hypothetical protein